MTELPSTERTRLRRLHKRGSYDRAVIDAVLDAGTVCHVGYVIDGAPYVTPTMFWRDGDHVYWHGSSASRMLRSARGSEVCLTVTHFDGLVLARSGFHHSANFRSAMLFGRAERVDDPDLKLHQLKMFMDGLLPGRWDELRPATAQELKATTLLFMPIDEASAKIRDGGPVDDEEDYALPIWAGIVPLRLKASDPIACSRLGDGIVMPDNVASFIAENR